MSDIGETMRALRDGTAHPGMVAHAEGVLAVAEHKVMQLLDLHYQVSVTFNSDDAEDKKQLETAATEMYKILSDVDQATAMSMIMQLTNMLVKAATTAVQGGWRPTLDMLDNPHTLWELRQQGITNEEIEQLREELRREQR